MQILRYHRGLSITIRPAIAISPHAQASAGTDVGAGTLSTAIPFGMQIHLPTSLANRREPIDEVAKRDT